MSDDPFQEQDDPFMEGSGKAPAVTFVNVGDTVTGVVLRNKKEKDTKPDGTPALWDNGDQKFVYIFTLDTDEGERSLWVRGHMVKAIREAVNAGGFRTVIGTKLTVQHTGLGEPKKGFSPAKLFRAKVEAAPARVTASAALAPGEEPW
jgi:hypothetical protein